MTLSFEQLASWEKEAGIHLDKLIEVDEMIKRKLVDKNLARRMGTVAEDSIQILVSKLRNSLEDSNISEICNVLDKIKSEEPDEAIKEELEKVVREKGCDEDMNETIKNNEDNVLLLTMEVIKRLLKPA